MKKWPFLLSFLAFAAAAQTPQEVMTEARAAHEQKNYALYAEKIEKLAAMRPGHPVVLFNLAGAQALNGKVDDACRTVQRLAAMQVWFDLAAEHDLDSIRDSDCFRAVVRDIANVKTKRVGTSQIGFTIPLTGLITEGIAHDGVSGDFFVSSVRKNRIYRVSSKNGTTSLFFTPPAGLKGLNGIALDETRRLLWVAVSASERVESFTKADEGRAALIALSLNDGSLVRRLDVDTGQNLFLDSVAVTTDGTIYVSNSRGSLLRLRDGAEALETFVPPGTIRSPQAIVAAPDGKRLYVADYGGPIAIVSLADGSVSKVTLPADFAYPGIDGLALHGGALYAIQNGVEPNRLSRLQLDSTGSRVTSWKILEMNHPLMDEPTLGTVVGDGLYWIASSQGNKFEVQPPKLTELHEAVILKTKLK